MKYNIDNIKYATLRALMKDEILMAGLVLKGGNALQLAYNITERGSIDIDFSIENDFSELDFQRLDRIILGLLTDEFSLLGLKPFDVKLIPKPKSGSIRQWKGYYLEFKLINIISDKNFLDISSKRRNAIPIHNNNSTKYKVDISAYEYVEKATKRDLNGIILRVYTPEMIIIEKLRAICQSMKEYKEIVHSSRPKKRARDIYDICNLNKHFPDVENKLTKELVENIFLAKQVPLIFLGKIKDIREIYREDWNTVIATLYNENSLDDFDYCFDYVLKLVDIIRFRLDI